MVAVTITGPPSATPVTFPFSSTFAIDSSELSHVTSLLSAFDGVMIVSIFLLDPVCNVSDVLLNAMLSTCTGNTCTVQLP